MNLYNKYILPKITHALCGVSTVSRQRQKVVPLASGRVLEVGIGSGLNCPYYDPNNVEHLFGLDPSKEMWSIAQTRIKSDQFPVDFLHASAEQIPLENNSVDSVVMTYTLCSVPNTQKALSEIRRVLKPHGNLIFCEHGKAPDASVYKWQNRINPIWKKLGGGCNLNRHIPELIKAGGFNIDQLDTMYIPGLRIACFNYWGMAKIR